MGDVSGFATSLATEIKMRATVLKQCVCGQAQFGWKVCPVCGREAVVQDHGVVAYYHKNPVKRWWFKIKKAFGYEK